MLYKRFLRRLKQARALGTVFEPVRFKALHCSNLKRALMTAEALCEAQKGQKPPIYQSVLLREQNFGSGEGKKWNKVRIPGLSLEEHYEKGVYPAPRGRLERFPGGESLNDLSSRAETVINDILLPYVWGEDEEVSIGVVSHGLFLSELVAALIKRGDVTRKEIHAGDFRGMKNTGWTKLAVAVEKISSEQRKAGTRKSARLHVEVIKFNNHDHLSLLKRQRGGIGSSAYDPRQKGIRGFLAGGSQKVKGKQEYESLVDEVTSS